MSNLGSSKSIKLEFIIVNCYFYFYFYLKTLIFQNIELYGEPDEIHHNPPNIQIELFDKDEYVILFNKIIQ